MTDEVDTRAKPDLILRYPLGEDGFGPGRPAGTAYAVVYVRPETNNILYERAIATAIRRRGVPLSIANINGALFVRDGILQEHYASQFRFAADPCGEMSRYPEMIAHFETYFKVPFDRSPLIGSFDAVRLLGMGEEELFETIVPETDFLDCWGQEFKRIFDFIVANPNLPAIVKRYTPRANVLAIVVRSREPEENFFGALNREIYSEIVSRRETPVIDGEKLDSLVWSERIRRTYHISTTHLMAMFDMADLVYMDDRGRLDVAETPLGRMLTANGTVSRERLLSLKGSQIARIGPKEGRTLVYLPHYAGDPKSIEGMIAALTDID
jgi:hypothetical protein